MYSVRSVHAVAISLGGTRRREGYRRAQLGITRIVETFEQLLASVNPPDGNRKWVYAPYDQLTAEVGPLSEDKAKEAGVLLIESREFLNRRPYHKRKLAIILANMRHFALEQARRGVAVRYLRTNGTHAEAIQEQASALGPITVMLPAERELRVELQPLVDSGLLVVVPHKGWLTKAELLDPNGKGAPYKMDSFYRRVRQSTGVLMDGSEPIGAAYSLDSENREPWHGDPPEPEAPSFPVDSVKDEVAKLVETEFADHPGVLDVSMVPCSIEDAHVLWDWAKRECLPHFGPYEDAMSWRSRGLFHTRMSCLINIHRVTPQRVLSDVLEMELPLQSKEGFVRQVIGWREYVKHVHDSTDGFTRLPPKNGPNALDCNNPLPPAWWWSGSGMTCLDTVVEQVWEDGWSHHITRLMILSNIAALLDVSPRELTDWFWVAYDDAYDWVVEPNVLGMGTYALGDLMTTKPYIAGAPYINRMSDYCERCRFDPGRNCPITPLYWAFLERHRTPLRGNPRIATQLAAAAKRGDRIERDRRVYETVLNALLHGDTLTPALLGD